MRICHYWPGCGGCGGLSSSLSGPTSCSCVGELACFLTEGPACSSHVGNITPCPGNSNRASCEGSRLHSHGSGDRDM